MTAPVLAVRGLRKRFGGLVASDSIDLDVGPGEIHALIGPNGAGKTTLIAQLCGELVPDSGTIALGGEILDGLPPAARVARGIARTFQVTDLLPDFTAAENVALAAQVRDGHSFRFLRDARRDAGLRARALDHLAAVDMADRADILVASLSHGEAKLLELAIALATGPRLLLLDEPLAGLGPAESAAMVERLRGLGSRAAMLLVEHDMGAVFSLADRVSVLVHGRVIASGSVAEIRDDPAVRAAYLGEGAV
jgi:branched-chain amino acid transport system ATP-binding protein